MNANIVNAIGENVGELSSEPMEVDQEDGVANLIEAETPPQQPRLPTSTSSQDTIRPSMNRQRDAERPEARYFVEGDVLDAPEVRVLETLNGEMVCIFSFFLPCPLSRLMASTLPVSRCPVHGI